MPDEDLKLAIIVEMRGRDRPLVELDLPLARVLEAYVDPYEADEPFRVDGVSVKRDNVERFKIVRQSAFFAGELHGLGRTMRHQAAGAGKEVARHYQTVFDDLLRSSTEDVTNQLIRAYASKKPSRAVALLDRAKQFRDLADSIRPIIEALVTRASG